MEFERHICCWHYLLYGYGVVYKSCSFLLCESLVVLMKDLYIHYSSSTVEHICVM